VATDWVIPDTATEDMTGAVVSAGLRVKFALPTEVNKSLPKPAMLLSVVLFKVKSILTAAVPAATARKVIVAKVPLPL
jgi:hypothetical protein